MRTKIFNALKVSALAVALSLGVGYAYAWVSPTVAPTGGNAAAPINVSSTAQVKNGTLQVTGLGVGTSPMASYAVYASTPNYGGVFGQSSLSSGVGVYGTNNFGSGLMGVGDTGVTANGVTSGVNAQGHIGVFGSGTTGAGGEFHSSSGNGVTAISSSPTTYGLYASGATGVGATGTNYGVYSTSNTGTGVGAVSTSGVGLFGQTSSGTYGVEGFGGTAAGVAGFTSTAGAMGVWGSGPIGVWGSGQGGGDDFHGGGGEYGKAGVWSNASSRDLKENFVPVDNQSILAKIVSLPMTQWNYKSDKKAVHLGPIAQDFYAVFGLGNDNTSISTIDPSGVALVGVKALNEKVEAQQKEIDELKAEIQALKK